MVSEILSRVAPGGVSVEPGFELVDEGLGARIDANRPATIRAHVPALDEASVRRATETVESALGHLQAFGLRPIGNLRTRVVQEDDWAEAWKQHFHVQHLGRRLEDVIQRQRDLLREVEELREALRAQDGG